MRRTLVLATLCLLLVAAVGATTTVAAGPANKYQVTYNGLGVVGTVTVKATTYQVSASGLDNGLYHLFYTDSSGRYDLGPAVANSGGRLQANGAWIGVPVTGAFTLERVS